MLDVQGGASLPAAAPHSLPGMRSNSLQQSKGTGTLAAPQEQVAPERPPQEAMEEDTAHSPVAEHQVIISFALLEVLSVYHVIEFNLKCWSMTNRQAFCVVMVIKGTFAHVNCKACTMIVVASVQWFKFTGQQLHVAQTQLRLL